MRFSRSPLPTPETNLPLRDPSSPNGESWVTAEEVPNFHRVDSSLYRGGRPRESEDVYLKIALLGIRSIVNLEREAEALREKVLVDRVNQRLRSEGRSALEFLHFPIGGSFQTFVTGWPHGRVLELFRKIKEAPKPILLNCHYGRDRTGAAVILYRLKLKEVLSIDQAYREARRYGFSVFDFGLKRTLRRYQNPKPLSEVPDPGAH